MTKTQQRPKITSIMVLAKFSDGKIRQVLLDKDDSMIVLSVIGNSLGGLRVLEKTVDYVDWEDKHNLDM